MDSTVERVELAEVSGEEIAEDGSVHPKPLFVLALIFAITPLIALGLGLYFRNSCPISLTISRLMIVSGAIGLVLVFLILILALIIAYSKTPEEGPERICCTSFCWIGLLIILVVIFLIIWSALGIGWLSSIRRAKQFDPEENETTFCHPVLYYSAWIYTIASLVLGSIFLCVLRCLVPRHQLRDFF